MIVFYMEKVLTPDWVRLWLPVSKRSGTGLQGRWHQSDEKSGDMCRVHIIPKVCCNAVIL